MALSMNFMGLFHPAFAADLSRVDFAFDFGGEDFFGEDFGFVDHLAEIGSVGAVADIQQVFKLRDGGVEAAEFLRGVAALLGGVGQVVDKRVFAFDVGHADKEGELGAKVGGRVVPGSVRYDQRTLDLRFTLVDIASGRTSFPVLYNGPLPDTFEEGRDVVVEGKMNAAGTFEATTVLTKCGSRYEAVDEELRA